MAYSFDTIIPREGTNAYKLELRGKVFGRADVLPLWVADMDFAAPPEVARAIQQRAAHGIYGYTVRGDWFNNCVADWMQRRHQWQISPDWVEYGPGVVPQLVMAITAFTEPGDKIIIQTPVYPPFYSVVKENGRQLEENPLIEKDGQYSMDFDLLAKQAADANTKMLILCQPHNPVGRLWTKEELTRLANICLENNVLMVSDEIHSDLMLYGNKHLPLASLSPEVADRTITFMAPSKTFNIAGFSTSFAIIGNEKLMSGYRKALMAMHQFTGNIFGAMAMEAAYSHGEPWLEELLVYLQGNADKVVRFLNSYMPEVNASPIEATYLMWLDFRKWGMTQSQLRGFIFQKAGVGLNDGTSFGPGGIGFMRLNIGSPWAVVEKGLTMIAEARAKL
ncbi:MAG: PatB family C-S lyase [Breznakibacter sp.]